MGCVYSAKDLELGRDVAIKTLLPGANPDRFITESKIAACLPHPGIPPVYSIGALEDSTPYLTMKLIQGRTLAELLQERPSPRSDLPRFTQIFEQIAQAVGFAHSQGIVHRDLKPLNVMVGAFGEVQVMDWGLAKDLSNQVPACKDEAESPLKPATETRADEQLTAMGAIMGTPGFMAPEQARGEAVDARADVFALGSTLATILTGQPAFVGSTARESIAKAATADLADVHERLDVSGADPELRALAKRCLEAKPENRPRDAHEVAAQVGAYRAGVELRLREAEAEAAGARVRQAEQMKRRRVWRGLCRRASARHPGFYFPGSLGE